MSLVFTSDAPPGVRWFTRLLFFREPLPEEVPEIAAALALLRRRWAWVLGAYIGYVGVLVAPGLLRGRDGSYALVAVLAPHLALYLLLMLSAYGWVGYRVNLGNLGEFLASYRRNSYARALIAWSLIAAAAGVATGLMGTRISPLVGPAVGQWLDDTFTPGVMLLLLAVVLIAVPELIAQLRLRQHALGRELALAQTMHERLARHTAESELRLLQAQVEPHFLYNTLANLRFLVQSNHPDALRMTDALIDYLRTSVPDMRAQQVTLGREFDHARHYLDIMQMRMQGRLRYSVELPDDLREVALPPLVVLTLVENAIKHGIGPLVEGGSVALAAALDTDGSVRIDVRDDGQGMPEGRQLRIQAGHDRPPTASGDGSKTGIANAFTRLQLTYGESARLQLVPQADDAQTSRGVCASFWVPRAVNLPSAPDDGLSIRVEVQSGAVPGRAAPQPQQRQA
jgi:signal transduction histidine kinase